MLLKKEQTDSDTKAVVSLYLSKIIQYCAKYDLTTKNELERILGALPAIDISMDEFLDETLDKKNIDKKALLNSFIKKYGLDNFSNKANAAIHAPEEGTQDHNLHKIFYTPSLLIKKDEETNIWLLYNNKKSDFTPLLRAIIQFIMLDYIKTKFPEDLPDNFSYEEKFKILKELLKEKSENLFNMISKNIETQSIINFISGLYGKPNNHLIYCMYLCLTKELELKVHLEYFLASSFLVFWFDRLLKNLKATSYKLINTQGIYASIKNIYSIFVLGLNAILSIALSSLLVFILALRMSFVALDGFIGKLISLSFISFSAYHFGKTTLKIIAHIPFHNLAINTWLNHLPILLYLLPPHNILANILTAFVFELGRFYPKGFPTNILFGTIGTILICSYFIAEQLEKLIPDSWFFDPETEENANLKDPEKISLEFKEVEFKEQKTSITPSYNNLNIQALGLELELENEKRTKNLLYLSAPKV